MLNRALKVLRTYHRLTQAELANRLGISNSYLSQIESGEKNPQLHLIETYATIFKIPASSILLFSESLAGEGKRGRKPRVAAANKILRLLEWIEEKNTIDEAA